MIKVTLLIFVGIALVSCKKEHESTDPSIQGILYPFRLTHDIDDQATLKPLSMFIDSKETKWITYQDRSGTGIIRFDGNVGDKYPNPDNPVPLQTGTTLAAQTEDANGAVYFTSAAADFSSFRLYKYENDLWQFWDVSAVPCRELYFSKSDNLLYFVYGDQVHRAAMGSNFSDPSVYQKVEFELPDEPQLIQSNFDGHFIHLISGDRYFVIDTQGEIQFYSTSFSGISFSYMYASNPNTSAYMLGGNSRQDLYKLYQGRWAKFPLSNLSLSSITVDLEENIYVNVIPPSYSVGKYLQDGSIQHFTFGNEKTELTSTIPVVVDKSNVKWVVINEGLVRLP